MDNNINNDPVKDSSLNDVNNNINNNLNTNTVNPNPISTANMINATDISNTEDNKVVKSKSILKKILIIFLSILLIAGISIFLFLSQKPKNIIKKSVLNTSKDNFLNINFDISSENSSSTDFTIEADINIDSENKENILANSSLKMNFADMLFDIDSIFLGKDIYIKLNKGGILSMFLGDDILNKWVYIKLEDIKNNPIMSLKAQDTSDTSIINESTTTDVQKNKSFDEYIKDFDDFMDKDILIFNNKKIAIENGNIVRKDYFSIDSQKWIDYVQSEFSDMNSSTSTMNDYIENVKNSKINEAYIVTDLFKPKLSSIYIDVSNISDEKTPINLKLDAKFSSLKNKPDIKKPENYTTLEKIFQDMIGLYQPNDVMDENAILE